MLTLKALNSDATLNNFMDIGNHKLLKGQDAELVFQLFQPEKKIRYIPDAGAVITVDLKNSDGTVLTKTAAVPFADDRSIFKITLTDIESATLISQNVIAKIDEGGDIQFAMLQFGLQMVSLTQGC